MARTFYMEGTEEALPDEGFANVRPFINEYTVGFGLLFLIFFSQLPWGTVASLLPKLGLDTWTAVGFVLILVLRTFQMVVKEPMGGDANLEGVASPLTSKFILYEVLGEIALTAAFCVLLFTKNWLVIFFVLLFSLSRFKSTPDTETSLYFPEFDTNP